MCLVERRRKECNRRQGEDLDSVEETGEFLGPVHREQTASDICDRESSCCGETCRDERA